MRRPKRTRQHLKRLGYIRCVDCGMLRYAVYVHPTGGHRTKGDGSWIAKRFLVLQEYAPRCERCKAKQREAAQPILDFGMRRDW